MTTFRSLTLVVTMICMTGAFLAVPKEHTLGAIITKNAMAYKNRGI